MCSKPIVPTLFLLLSFLFFSKTLHAQLLPNKTSVATDDEPSQTLVVNMSGAKMRMPLSLPNTGAKVELCDLVPGETYMVVAIGMTQGQTTRFALSSSDPLVAWEQQRPHAARFTAMTTCVELWVHTDEPAAVPMYLSVKCETCPEAEAWKKNLLKETGAAVLQVQGGQTAEQLIKQTLINADCFDVENVTYSGFPGQIGTFSNGNTNIGFPNGVIIATGNISVAPGPNLFDNASAGYGSFTPDSDLSQLAQSNNIYDRASIEFDFTPTESPVSFQFVFASEEYCEYVFSLFNDVFGFFISGPGIAGTKNIALVPNTNNPITINNINHLVNNQYYTNNQTIWSSNLCGQFPSFNQAINEVEFDGFTKQLVATVNVIPCETYRIRLKIADVGDGVFDSAVFLKGGSFQGGGDATVRFVVNGTPDAEETIEGCDNVAIQINRIGSDQSQPITVTFSVGGTAIPGEDYEPLDTAYTIPAGQSQILVPVNIFKDFTAEDSETIVLLLDNSCSCEVTEKTLTILDYVPMNDTLLTVLACNAGGGTILNAELPGGKAPYTYFWSTNETTPTITVSPSVNTTYSVTVSDACDEVAEYVFEVEVTPLIEITENIAFCAGGSVTIGDSVYTEPTTVVDTLLAGPGGCDTVLTYNLTQLPLTGLIDTITFCAGDSVEINGVFYAEPGMVLDTIPGMAGDCDTILTYILEELPLNAMSDTLGFCLGGSVTIGDSTYTEPTVVEIVLPGENGDCDTLLTIVVELVPQIVITQTIAFCPGESVTLGDTTYADPGTVSLTLPGSNGDCDTLATYILELRPQASFTQTIAFCPGESVTLGDTTYADPGTVSLTLPGSNGDCDTLATYILELRPQASFTQTIAFCPGESVTLGDTTYADPGTVSLTLPGSNGDCDTLATYILELRPQASFTQTIGFCPGESVTLGDTTYADPGTVSLTLPGSNGDCDTLATYILELKPQVSFTQTIGFCPGESVTLGDTTYADPGTVSLTLPGSNGDCDTLATYILELKPQVSFTQTYPYCPGDTVFINGNAYTTAGTYFDTLPGANGECDTLATYVLVSLTPAPSTVNLICPSNVTLTVEPPVLNYNLPNASTDCDCPGLSLQMTNGLPPGSIFPIGQTEICYMAKDSCGNTTSCCFTVTVPEEEPCDEATAGCIKYELLGITKDDKGNKTYRFRVRNNCPTRLMYAAFSLPPGVTALSPANNSIYTAPSGREYSVRNPNFSPFYSIRFLSDMAGIVSGESDIFEFTLPALANPSNILAIVRVEPKIFHQAYLQTFNCPVQTISKPAVQSPSGGTGAARFEGPALRVFPNPTDGLLLADLSGWTGEQVWVRVFDAQGQQVQQALLSASEGPQTVMLAQGLANGLYFLEATGDGAERQVVRFVLQR
ncbi:MAG: choice-of-anchor L domain-containing protein [Saprospiraceae bacterium]|nr:choice-of-anchor L domain-containing protein [Saprospiraceae bacterium]